MSLAVFRSDGSVKEGDSALAVSSITANYTATLADDVILCDASGGAFTVTVPVAASYKGKLLRLKKTDSSTNQVTVSRSGSDTLEGATSFGLRSQNGEVALISNGTNWYCFAQRPGLPGTALPSVAFDGQVIRYHADTTNGVVWELIYRSAETTYKWLFVGGAPLFDEVNNDSSETTTSTTYTTLTTAGPAVTVPLAGDYDVRIGFRGYNSGANQAVRMSYAIGATAASDNDAVETGQLTNAMSQAGRQRRKTGLAAGTTLSARYKANAGTGTSGAFGRREMIVTPVRVV